MSYDDFNDKLCHIRLSKVSYCVVICRKISEPRRSKSWKKSGFEHEIENFKRATHQTPIFARNSQGQDWNFQARLKFSSEIENFKRELEVFKRSSEIVFFSRFWPSGKLSWHVANCRDIFCPVPFPPSLLDFADLTVGPSHKVGDQKGFHHLTPKIGF